jgi:hypothetical protein
MRKFRALLAVLTFATFAVGCQDESAKKTPPEQKSDLGAPASPSSANSTPTPPPKTDHKTP